MFKHIDNNTPEHKIGVVVPRFWDGKQFPFLYGLRDAIKSSNIQGIVFKGDYKDFSYSNAIQNRHDCSSIILDLIKAYSIEGLIVNFGSLPSKIEKLELIDLCNSWFKVPILNISAPINNCLNITADNHSGMVQLIDHFINYHGYSKICFIKGPIDSPDAIERYSSFLSEMRKWNKPVDESMVAGTSVWSIQDGEQAAKILLDRYQSEIDAIVCSSDILAIGAYNELKKRNYKIPIDIALSGFNDNSYAEISNPPLTTVTINTYKRSHLAINIFKDFFDGIPIPPQASIPSELVIRQSCGCLSESNKSYVDCCNKKSFFIPESDDKSCQAKLIDDIKNKVGNCDDALLNSILPQLVDSFMLQCKHCFDSVFLPAFYSLLHKLVYNNALYWKTHRILNVFYEYAEKTLDDEIKLQYIKQYILQARIVIGDVAVLNNTLSIIDDQEIDNRISSLNYGYKRTECLDDLYKLIQTDIPRMSIPQFYLFLYENREKPLERFKLVVSYNKIEHHEQSEEIDSMNRDGFVSFIARVMNQDKLLFIEPLFYSNNQIGFTIFTVDSFEKAFRTLFPAQLSCAIWGAILNNKEKEVEQILKKQYDELIVSNSKLEQQTLQLNDAFVKLEQNKEQLLLTEKMASIGKLTSKILSELQTPLTLAKSAITELLDASIEYRNTLNKNKTITNISALNSELFLSHITIAENNVNKTQHFVRNIKTQTRNSTSNELAQFDLIEITQNVIVFLQYTHQDKKVLINLRTETSNIVIDGSSIKMTQVLTNTITNSIESITNSRAGLIMITIQKDMTNAVVTITDNGCGIKPEDLSKIFDPMFTTKIIDNNPGLGLSVVHDIIYGEFDGKIEVESKFGEGTTIKLFIPTE